MHFFYSRKEAGGTQQKRLNRNLIVLDMLSAELLKRDTSGQAHKGIAILAVSKPFHESLIQKLVPVFSFCEVAL
jgi:hypothetical protein